MANPKAPTPGDSDKFYDQAESEGQKERFEKQKEDLKDYFERVDQLRAPKSPERAAFEKQLNAWNQDCEKDPETIPGAIREIRRAGVNEADNRENPLKRHALLSSAFLEQPTVENHYAFKVNFQGNNLAERKVGAADMLPPNITAIAVMRADGTKVDRAVRRLNPYTGRIGYYNEAKIKENIFEYAYVHTGDEIRILETKKINNSGLDLSTFMENVEIYQHGATDDTKSEVQEKGDPRKKWSPNEGKNKTPRSEVRKREILQESEKDLQALRRQLGTAPTEELPALQRRLLAKAKEFAEASKNGNNRFAEDFQNISQLREGKVGCAWVVSTILKEAGLTTAKIMGVDAVAKNLQERGWQVIDPAKEEPQAGDIVIWDRLPAKQNDQGGWEQGHKHIGIVSNPPSMVIDNNGVTRNGPEERPLMRFNDDGTPRKIEMYLRAPSPPARPRKTPERKEGHINVAPQDQYVDALQNIIKENPQFLKRVDQIAGKIGCSRGDLLKIMWKESRLNTRAVNKQNGDPEDAFERSQKRATGLIQFMPSTAEKLGTTNQDIFQMSAMEQLDYVEKYFEPYFGKIHNYADLYMAVFYPAALGKPDDWVLGAQKSAKQVAIVFNQNPGIAPKGQGYITVADFRRYAGPSPSPGGLML